jgi:hypothetical protein
LDEVGIELHRDYIGTPSYQRARQHAVARPDLDYLVTSAHFQSRYGILDHLRVGQEVLAQRLLGARVRRHPQIVSRRTRIIRIWRRCLT